MQKVQVLLEDDLTGGEADETVTFGLDGATYEIDLNTKNADALRAALEGYVEAGRKTGGRVKRGHAPGKKPGEPTAEDIRSWAEENGYEVNKRGRVPANIREAYDNAH